jgi:hypothetical protein
MLATSAFAVELFRYRGAANDGGTLEYVFEAGQQNSPNAVTKEKAAEIACDWIRNGNRHGKPTFLVRVDKATLIVIKWK